MALKAKQLVPSKTVSKLLSLGRMPTDHDAEYEHGLTDIGAIVGITGYMTNTENGACYPLPFATPVPGESVSLVAGLEYIAVNVGTCDRSKFEGYATIEYVPKEPNT